jgi:hypothetical protein
MPPKLWPGAVKARSGVATGVGVVWSSAAAVKTDAKTSSTGAYERPTIVVQAEHCANYTRAASPGTVLLTLGPQFPARAVAWTRNDAVAPKGRVVESTAGWRERE